jgi:hypothetical protein
MVAKYSHFEYREQFSVPKRDAGENEGPYLDMFEAKL